MNIKFILPWLALAFVAWWAIEDPAAVTHIVSNIGNFLKSSAAGLSSFFATIG